MLNSLPRIKIKYAKVKKRGHVCGDNINMDKHMHRRGWTAFFFSSGQGLVARCCEQGDEFEVMEKVQNFMSS
jgi:hypothetical protein